MVSSRRIKWQYYHNNDNSFAGDSGSGESDIASQALVEASSSLSSGVSLDHIIDSAPGLAADDTTGVASAEGSGEKMASRLDSVSISGQREQSISTPTNPLVVRPTRAASSDPSHEEKKSIIQPTMAMDYASSHASSLSNQGDQLLDAASFHVRAAFAPPIVTKTTRRETFAASSTSCASSASTAAKYQRKQKKKSGGTSNGRPLLHPSQNLSSSSSSGDEESASMMDLFSPPPPSILRTRPRGIQHIPPPPPPPLNSNTSSIIAEGSTTAEITTSTPFDISVEENAVDELVTDHHQSRYHHHPLNSSSSKHFAKFSATLTAPPTIFTPHATNSEGGRMAMSTSQKRLHHGQLVHVPKSRESEAELFHEEEEVDDERRILASAPAKFHVSILLSVVAGLPYFLIAQVFNVTFFTRMAGIKTRHGI